MIFKEYEKCTLCPRMCLANRNKKEHGFCGETSTLRLGRVALHFWEEPCISGAQGSGTVFFSGCNLRCCYCQNFKLSRGEEGVTTDEKHLADVFLKLRDEGAHNINLVTGEHFAPHIKEAVTYARKRGLNIPIILNCSGYISEKTIEYLKGVIDIYLVDFKYINPETAKKYSYAPDYPEVAKKALSKMVSFAGKPQFDNEGMMKKGVLVRHLCLPEYGEESKKIIKYIFDKYRTDVVLSVMSQYTPLENCKKYPEINRKLTEEEYDKIVDYCVKIGIEDAYIQDGESSSESFIPKFNGEGVLF